MKAINRLYQYFDYKKIKPTRLEKELGLSNGYLGIQLKREADIGSAIIEKLINNCLDLNINWLITGHGNMLVDNYTDRVLSDSKPPGYVCQDCKNKDELIAVLKDQVNTFKKLVKNLESEKSSHDDEQKRKAAS